MRRISFLLFLLLGGQFAGFSLSSYAASGKACGSCIRMTQIYQAGLASGLLFNSVKVVENKPNGVYEVKSYDENDISAAVLAEKPSMTLEDFSTVDIVFDNESGRPFIEIGLNDNGRREFNELTTANVGKPLAVVVKGKIVSMPFINMPINSKHIRIGGGETLAELTDIANSLKAAMKKL